jgi:predicted nucleic acid-binding protein
MKPKVYIETTIISYLAARPSRDLIVAGHQQITHEWWQTARPSFAAVSSQLVAREAGAGDSEAAAARLAFLTGLTLLEISEEALTLTQRLLQSKAIPQEFPEDALHVAVAVVNGIEYLLTWNYKHLANAGMRSKIEATCRELGYEAVVICTPEELMEV